MAIYTPEEAAAIQTPKNLDEAIGKGVLGFLCRSAPILFGYGLASGNLPAAGFGAGATFACGLPFVPVNELPPPGSIPFQGGRCPTFYRIFVRQRITNATSCAVVVDNVAETIALGPISIRTGSDNTVNTLCLGNVQSISNEFLVVVDGAGGEIQRFGGGWPALGDFVAVRNVVRLDGLDDNCGNPPISAPVLPPGFDLPPGYPENPILPPIEIPVPYKPPSDPPGKPPVFFVLPIGPVILPPIIAPTFAPSVPISIPVSIPVSIAPNISGSITVQIDQGGNIRTPPDLICPCETGDDAPIVPSCPETVTIDLPYFTCEQGGSFEVQSVELLASSVSPGLVDKFLSSANLAEIGCDAIGQQQEPPALIASGRSGDITVSPELSPLLGSDIVSVEVRLSDYPEDDYRELTTFPGAGQRKFGVVSYCLDGQEGGGEQIYLWDEKTYVRIPKRIKPGRLKILLRPRVSWELWDTGERT